MWLSQWTCPYKAKQPHPFSWCIWRSSNDLPLEEEPCTFLIPWSTVASCYWYGCKQREIAIWGWPECVHCIPPLAVWWARCSMVCPISSAFSHCLPPPATRLWDEDMLADKVQWAMMGEWGLFCKFKNGTPSISEGSSRSSPPGKTPDSIWKYAPTDAQTSVIKRLKSEKSEIPLHGHHLRKPFQKWETAQK